jgi:hypothetical protein
VARIPASAGSQGILLIGRFSRESVITGDRRGTGGVWLLSQPSLNISVDDSTPRRQK